MRVSIPIVVPSCGLSLSKADGLLDPILPYQVPIRSHIRSNSPYYNADGDSCLLEASLASAHLFYWLSGGGEKNTDTTALCYPSGS